MAKKNTTALLVGVAALAAIGYIGYRLLKDELDKLDDIDWGNLDEAMFPGKYPTDNDLQ